MADRASLAERAPAPARGERPLAVYTQLRHLIVHGRLAPGSPLVETDIAARFRVSRTPVRTALQRLHQDGLIVEADGPRLFRYVVAPLTRDDARSLYHIIAELEGLAAASVAGAAAPVRRRVAAALAADNALFRAEGEQRRPDHDRLYDLDAAFHGHYVEEGANARLRALHASLEPQAERYSRLYTGLLADEIPTSAAEHDAIVRAIADGDPDAAHQAVRTNWRNATERLGRVIDHAGERGSW